MKSEQLQTFSNSEIGEIRGFLKDGEPWFLSGQICRCLGLKDAGRQIKAIEERYKIAGIKGAHSMRPLLDTAGGKQKVLCVSESILYELIFQSRKQRAIRFRAWVTTEVLPSLRKHGEYRMSGKLITHDLHDGIRDKIVPGISSDMGKKFVYSNFHKLINKSLGLDSKTVRDNFPDELLEKLAYRENLVKALIDEGKDYHQIKDVLLNI